MHVLVMLIVLSGVLCFDFTITIVLRKQVIKVHLLMQTWVLFIFLFFCIFQILFSERVLGENKCF